MKLNRTKLKYYSNTEKILDGFKIASQEETIEELLKGRKSIARFGDGEFDMIYGIGMKYQKYNEKLSKRLKEVLFSNEEDLLVGIYDTINYKFVDKYVDFAQNFWRGWLKEYQFKLLKILSKNKQYYSTAISRFYIDFKDKSGTAEYVKKLKKLWDGRDVVIIEGEQSRLGVGNDLFDNMKSIQRIICPSEHAFEIYDKIYNEAIKVDKNKLILLALGPTATVLAYDLYKAGYQAIDIGHVDIEYEWFLRKATTKIKIDNKYVTEAKDGRTNIADVKDEKYQNEIIARVLS